MNKTVSVIIPCLNEVNHIEKCIKSLNSNLYPKELVSIYVCDGMSNDGTRELVKKHVIDNGNLYLLDNGNLKVEGCLLRVCGHEEWKPMDVIINEEDGTRSAVLRE